MDNLSRMAVLATNAGMSYGQWMALQGDTKPERTEEKELPDGWQKCEWCGAAFKLKTNKGKRFCDASCQRQANDTKRRKRNAEYMAMYRERKKAKRGDCNG